LRAERPTEYNEDYHPVDGPAPEWPEAFARSAADREALACLLAIPSLTPRRLLRLAQTERAASACLRAVSSGRMGRSADRDRATPGRGRELLQRAAELGARFVSVGEPEYPRVLLDLADPPAGLFVIGRPLSQLEPRVAIVGARNCTATGEEVARTLAMRVGMAGVAVVSGGARGIDRAAHEGALLATGRTIAVLASGVDISYPPTHRELFTEIATHGAIVTEYPPGVRANTFRFPARNRIIAALCRAVVVVEGAKGSGSMITADHALDVGRDVLAVPGPVTSDLSYAPHRLIREGATLIRSADDLLEELGMAPSGWHPDRASTATAPVPLTEDEECVLGALHGATPVDRVAMDSRMEAPRVLGVLIGLELRGAVRQSGGRWERRPGWS